MSDLVASVNGIFEKIAEVIDLSFFPPGAACLAAALYWNEHTAFLSTADGHGLGSMPGWFIDRAPPGAPLLLDFEAADVPARALRPGSAVDVERVPTVRHGVAERLVVGRPQQPVVGAVE